ncbi:MAG: CBS domain-containing protein [bacterium]|nr:CBS domain-containing protein [bacterium]
MKIQDVMSKNVVTVEADTLFPELWTLIVKEHINSVPVVDKFKKLLGIITQQDLLTRLYPDNKEFIEDFTLSSRDFEEMEKRIQNLKHVKSKDIMCTRVLFSRGATPVMRALSRMIVRRVNQLPVIDEQDQLIGMITKGDVFYALFAKSMRSSKRKRNP